ncbi:MAG TPA: hypothetical protein VFW40_10315, partial [Capsulimonadaceae bacterium]|nr:hypothetical protein [Capsulimonadaceae bacterium]
TIRLTDRLMKAGKDFDLVIITGSDHTDGGPYGERRRRDYFVRHLLGVEPPDRNIPTPPVKPVDLKPRPLIEISFADFGGGPPTTIEFHNHTAQELNLYTVLGNGNRRPFGSVSVGASRSLNTTAGTSWIAATKEGQPVALFVADIKPGIAEIKPAGRHQN